MDLIPSDKVGPKAGLGLFGDPYFKHCFILIFEVVKTCKTLFKGRIVEYTFKV